MSLKNRKGDRDSRRKRVLVVLVSDTRTTNYRFFSTSLKSQSFIILVKFSDNFNFFSVLTKFSVVSNLLTIVRTQNRVSLLKRTNIKKKKNIINKNLPPLPLIDVIKKFHVSRW